MSAFQKSSSLKLLLACVLVVSLLAFFTVGCLGGGAEYDEDWEEWEEEDFEDDVEDDFDDDIEDDVDDDNLED